MNNPTVYGHCDAGCKRRVPTYEEFERSASVIAIAPNKSGDYELELGKKYRICSTVMGGWGDLEIKANWRDAEEGVGGTKEIQLPAVYSHIDSFIFCLMDTSDGNIYYSCDGVITNKGITTELTEVSVIVSGAKAVYLINEGAYIEVKGLSAYETAVENGFEGTEAEWLESLKPTAEIDELKNLVNIMINYYNGERETLEGAGLSSNADLMDDFPCTITITASHLCTVKDVVLKNYTGFKSEPSVTVSGNVIMVNGVTSGKRTPCTASVTCLLEPKAIG